MSDIVERLRGSRYDYRAISDGLLTEAATEIERLRAELEASRHEARCNRTRFEFAISHLLKIESFIKAGDVVLPDGRRFEFHPPDALVREAWTALTEAIRETHAAIDAAMKESK